MSGLQVNSVACTHGQHHVDGAASLDAVAAQCFRIVAARASNECARSSSAGTLWPLSGSMRRTASPRSARGESGCCECPPSPAAQPSALPPACNARRGHAGAAAVATPTTPKCTRRSAVLTVVVDSTSKETLRPVKVCEPFSGGAPEAGAPRATCTANVLGPLSSCCLRQPW